MLVSLAGSAQTADQSLANCSGWKALRNIRTSTYYVSATCEMPTPGHTVELVPADPQGSDASVCVLNEVVHAPEGMVAQVITGFKLYCRNRTRTSYKEFVIKPGGIHVSVEEMKPKAAPSATTPSASTTEKK